MFLLLLQKNVLIRKRISISNTNQCNVFQTQNFCFNLVNTKTMQYLPSIFLENKIKFLYALCLSLFLKNKANKKINFIYLFFTHANHRTCYIVCVCGGVSTCNRTRLRAKPGRLLENSKTENSNTCRELFLPESDFKTSSAVNVPKKHPNFGGLETNQIHETQTKFLFS